MEFGSFQKVIFFAICSGICASLNSFFAKCSTLPETKNFANNIAENFLGLLAQSKGEEFINFLLRGFFIVLAVSCSIIMWSLFTAALSISKAAASVSIIDTTTNFLVTAVLSALVFNDSLELKWFIGAGIIVGGNVLLTKVESSYDNEENEVQDIESTTNLELNNHVGYVPIN